MTWGAVAIGGATLIGGMMSADAAGKAGDQQADAANNAANISNQQYQQNRNDLAPYRLEGNASLARLSNLLGLGPKVAQTSNFAEIAQPIYDKYSGGLPWDQVDREHQLQATQEVQQAWARAQQAQQNPGEYGSLLKDFTGADLQNEPGYQFRLNEGQKALERSAAAKGGLYSGATLKGLQKYGQDYASNEYGNAYNRDLQTKQSKYNFLAGLSGTGQTATAQTGQFGQNNAQYAGNQITSAGAARAAGTVGQSNAIAGGIQNAANLYGQQSMLNRFFPQNSGGNVPANSPYLP